MHSFLLVQTGFQPGEIVIQSPKARETGPVIVPAATRPTRFMVDPLTQGLFGLVRVEIESWPTPPQRHLLLTFDKASDAEASLADLLEALVAAEASEAAATSPAGFPWSLALALFAAAMAAMALWIATTNS